MREGQFIKQNIDRWKSYHEPTDDPDELAKRFTNLVDDLAYTKTYYPFSNTVKYVNSLAANIYLSIYKNKKQKSNRIITCWAIEMPLIIRKYHKTILASFVFFVVFLCLGILSDMKDPTFVRSILGDQYVDMTERNIANGDPFGVYKKGNEFAMFVQIAWNNISVSFHIYAMGIIFSLGTIYSLFTNSIMLGAFEHMFFQHGLGLKSILVVFVHGTLEMSSFIIEASAGLILGNSILFPRTYTRLESLKMGAKDSIKIVVCVIPIILLAAFFESYVTRHTEMPVLLSATILGSSLLFMLWYFVYYPIKVSKNVFTNENSAG